MNNFRQKRNSASLLIFGVLSILLFAIFCSCSSASKINIDNQDVVSSTAENPLCKSSPIDVHWEAEANMVVQVYKNGKLIYPKDDPHEEQSSGVKIPLKTGLYEIKVWVPRTMNFKSAWVEIGDK